MGERGRVVMVMERERERERERARGRGVVMEWNGVWG
jgi:hypothetical protein